MSRLSTLIVLVFLLISPGFSQQKILESALIQAESNGFSGVILVAEDGKILMEKAIGKRSFEQNVLLFPSDIFELASVSKQFTSMVLMMCQEKNLLSFDDPVEKYLEIPYKGITIRHLLTHTSGLPDYQAIMDEHWDKNKVAGNADILEYLNRYTPTKNFEPGDEYQYSNTGYVLLASIVEKASKKRFHRTVQGMDLQTFGDERHRYSDIGRKVCHFQFCRRASPGQHRELCECK